jgi:trk system potassium uptake protein TrkH
MDVDLQRTRALVLRDTLHPQRLRWFDRLDAIVLLVGMAAVLLSHSARRFAHFHQPWEFPVLVVAAMLWLTGTLTVRYRWSLAKPSFVHNRRAAIVVSVVWMVGLLAVLIFGPVLPLWTSRPMTRWHGFVSVSEVSLLLRGILALYAGLRGAAAGSFNPALVLVGSFVGLVAMGTMLLMFPRARVPVESGPAAGAPFVTALFTATSAACVTGLAVEDTPTYWSREGQLVILGLIQIGGLGIMTFGAFFGLIVSREIRFREHATIGDLLESEGVGNVRRLLLAIIGLTLGAELLGAIGLAPLWSDEPLGECLFLSVFHAVSAFCNAGFALTENSFVGQAARWPVWGVLSLLIVAGGLGFAVLFDLYQFFVRRFTRRRPAAAIMSRQFQHRLSLTTRIVLLTTGALLVCGTVGIFVLERVTAGDLRPQVTFPDAWFQSVALRTAGFNTVDIGALHPATKLLGILLMFIGASPGSTGGGVKTVAFSVAVLGLLSTLRGREHIECFGRTLPTGLVHRALAVLFLSLMLVMVTTLMLVLYEDREAYFLDYLFEAASAVATVGLSSTIHTEGGGPISVTQSLSTPSRLVLVAAMFLGRVGPLTLLLAIAGRSTTARYQYPQERVMLG